MLAGMSDFFRRTLGENIDLEFVGGAGLWQVEVDPSQMEATTLNLVVNAKDAMAGKGKLTIETSNALSTKATRNRTPIFRLGNMFRLPSATLAPE